MRLMRSKDYVRMPWKNGGGETAEIVASPAGATLAHFDWRVSMARVATDGPFSRFPGIDRTLAIVAGPGLRLAVDGRVPANLSCDSPPFCFPGDVSTTATLLRGEVLDFNVMTRRGSCSHVVQRVELHARAQEFLRTPLTLIFCQQGSVEASCGTEREHLERHDSLLCEDATARLQLATESRATLLLVAIEAAP